MAGGINFHLFQFSRIVTKIIKYHNLSAYFFSSRRFKKLLKKNPIIKEAQRNMNLFTTIKMMKGQLKKPFSFFEPYNTNSLPNPPISTSKTSILSNTLVYY